MSEFTMLPLGVYRLYWKAGGSSLAAVGQNQDRTRWFVPIDWTSDGDNPVVSSTEWDDVLSARNILSNRWIARIANHQVYGGHCPTCGNKVCTT